MPSGSLGCWRNCTSQVIHFLNCLLPVFMTPLALCLKYKKTELEQLLSLKSVQGSPGLFGGVTLMMLPLILIFSFLWRSMTFTEVWANPFCSLNPVPHTHSVPGWPHRVFSFTDVWKVECFFLFFGISRSGLLNKTKGKGKKRRVNTVI